MQIIDKEGRLFGLINVIDFIVLCFILSLTPMLYYGWKIAHKSKPKPQAIEIELKKKIDEYKLLLDTLTNQKDTLINQKDTLIKERDVMIAQKDAEKGILENKIENFLKMHTRAKKYFR